MHVLTNKTKYNFNTGIRDITLLGQNVNSYRDLNNDKNQSTNISNLSKGFKTVYKDKLGGVRFAELLERVASAVPNVRIRFTSPHPKDFPDEVLKVMKSHPNICKNIHLPAQSGNSSVLERMRRGYTRESYLELVDRIRSFLPHVALSSDFICGFCGETDDEFQDTISLIDHVKYNVAFLFAYSMREKTTAHRRYIDDVPEIIKLERIQEMIRVFRQNSEITQSKFVGKTELILVEGVSKKSNDQLYGRNDANIKVIIPKVFENNNEIKVGDFVAVSINYSNSQILKGIPLYPTSLADYYKDKI